MSLKEKRSAYWNTIKKSRTVWVGAAWAAAEVIGQNSEVFEALIPPQYKPFVILGTMLAARLRPGSVLSK